MRIRIAALMLVLALAFAGAGCASKGPYTDAPNPTVTITMENGEQIRLELYPQIAPNTVANFVSLAQAGFYDGLIFHRVIAGFMIQGGDPQGTGTGGPGYSIKGEFSANKFKNDLKHTRGVISMARANDYDSAGSQFFIMQADNDGLDGQYAAFGKVLDDDSLKVVDEIATTKTDPSDKPLTEWKIKSIIVDTQGYDKYKVEKIAE
jgi:peptidyl-prolyl cis-trans isomerase B (cyclophilin B)